MDDKGKEGLVQLSGENAVRFVSDWNMCALYALFDLVDFEFSVEVAARRLGISEDEVNRCMETLQDWDLLLKDESGKFLPPPRLTFIDDDFNEGFTHSVFKNSLLRAEPKMVPSDPAYFSFDVMHPSVIYKYRHDIMALLEKISTESRGMPGSEVYVFLSTFVKVSAPIINDTPVTHSAQKFAHDVRSPLSALNAISSRFPDLPDDIRDVLESATQRINKIAEDILTTKRRMECDSSVLESGFDLFAKMRSLVQEFKAINPNYNVQLKSNKERLLISEQRGDVLRVVSNLVNNAIEASKPQQDIYIILDQVDGDILIRIIDWGEGMSEETLKKVRLFGHSTKGGHGIGVRSAFQFAELNGGKVEINSEPGVGTQITIRFPI